MKNNKIYSLDLLKVIAIFFVIILHQFLTCVSIFLIYMIVELIRKSLFKITVDKVIDKMKIMNKTIEI